MFFFLKEVVVTNELIWFIPFYSVHSSTTVLVDST